MKKFFLTLFPILLILILILLFVNISSTGKIIETILTSPQEDPIVVWFVVAKYLREDFLSMAQKYKPDIVLLTVFAEDDIKPVSVNESFDLKKIVEELRENDVKVYFSYSLFSRSMYEEIKNTSLPVEKFLHVSSYSKYLRENNPEKYHELFDYYLENGIDPEKIPMVERKPVDGYYVEIGHYSMIDPLDENYNNFLVQVINETLQITKPDGLSFDHIRFFTFDEAYNPSMKKFIFENCGLDVSNYTPAPPFVLDALGWKEEDKIYYECRAKLIQSAVEKLLANFSEYKTFGTTMGMIDPARANGQYVELQAETFDGLLLMSYDKDPEEVARNVRETVARAKDKPVILGISKIVHPSEFENIKAGLENGAKGIYLLGYDFDEELHEYLLKIRKKT